MFNLDEQIAKWRQELAATGLAPEILNELEGHLREDIERQVRGVEAAEAFQVAVGRIGPARALKQEFNLVRRPGIVATLLRHKWKLAICSGAGLLAAVGLYALRGVEYQSQTKFFVQYVIPGGEQYADGEKKLPSKAGSATMLREKEILRSWDLSKRVALEIGPETILRQVGGGDDLNRAASMVNAGLSVTVPPNSSVINITFRHPDSKLPQPILREVVDTYLRMHVAANRSTGLVGVRESDEIARVSGIIPIQTPSAPLFDSAKAISGLPTIVALGVLVGFAWVIVAARLGESKLRPAR